MYSTFHDIEWRLRTIMMQMGSLPDIFQSYFLELESERNITLRVVQLCLAIEFQIDNALSNRDQCLAS